jgi:hypothetical protein
VSSSSDAAGQLMRSPHHMMNFVARTARSLSQRELHESTRRLPCAELGVRRGLAGAAVPPAAAVRPVGGVSSGVGWRWLVPSAMLTVQAPPSSSSTSCSQQRQQIGPLKLSPTRHNHHHHLHHYHHARGHAAQRRSLSTTRPWLARCHYDMLGVKSTATAAEIKEVSTSRQLDPVA